MLIKLKRAYEAPARADGYRVLVERLWPRGVSKDEAALDRWLKDIAPSPELRNWYGHDPEKWPEFQQRYQRELMANNDQVEVLRALCEQKTVTFIYAAKDEEHNSAVVLKAFLDG